MFLEKSVWGCSLKRFVVFRVEYFRVYFFGLYNRLEFGVGRSGGVKF